MGVCQNILSFTYRVIGESKPVAEIKPVAEMHVFRLIVFTVIASPDSLEPVLQR